MNKNSMVYTVSISSQGQISLPAAFRRKIGLEKKAKAIVSLENGKILVEPIPDLLNLRGSLTTTKLPLSNQELDELIAQAVAEDYGSKIATD